MCEGQAQSRPSGTTTEVDSFLEAFVEANIEGPFIEDPLSDSDTESTPEPNPEDFPEHDYSIELLDSDVVTLCAVFKDTAIEAMIQDSNLTALAKALTVLAKFDCLSTFCPDCRVNCALVEDNGRLRFNGDVTSAEVKNGKVQLNIN